MVSTMYNTGKTPYNTGQIIHCKELGRIKARTQAILVKSQLPNKTRSCHLQPLHSNNNSQQRLHAVGMIVSTFQYPWIFGRSDVLHANSYFPALMHILEQPIPHNTCQQQYGQQQFKAATNVLFIQSKSPHSMPVVISQTPKQGFLRDNDYNLRFDSLGNSGNLPRSNFCGVIFSILLILVLRLSWVILPISMCVVEIALRQW